MAATANAVANSVRRREIGRLSSVFSVMVLWISAFGWVFEFGFSKSRF
jgi:hypothetical protein